MIGKYIGKLSDKVARKHVRYRKGKIFSKTTICDRTNSAIRDTSLGLSDPDIYIGDNIEKSNIK